MKKRIGQVGNYSPPAAARELVQQAGLGWAIILNIVLLLMAGVCIPLSGQNLVPGDTSFFRSGQDEWNLVESVIRNQSANLLFLLERGADPDATAEGGMSALMYAAEMGDTLMIQILVLNGASTEATRVEKTTPLMVAVLNRHFHAAYVLLKLGANPDAKDDYGGCCLLYAAAMNQYDMADLLLFYGADPDTRDKAGNDALMTAVSMAFTETADVLLQNGLAADSRDKKKNTPLMVAAQKADTVLVSLLLAYGADTEAMDGKNYTPLAHAVRTGSVNTATLLADSGANIHHKISPSLNLYDLAVVQHRSEMAEWLKSRGAHPTPRPDFSEFQLVVGNSFGKNEYMLQGRLRLLDRKYGFFLETGIDVRPNPYRVHVPVNDTLLHQYREYRWNWAHGVGKEFILGRDESGLEMGASLALYGMLSFPSWRGIAENGPVKYRLAPSAALFVRGEIAGLSLGLERYHFGTLLEGKWKINISLYIRAPFKYESYESKEAAY